MFHLILNRKCVRRMFTYTVMKFSRSFSFKHVLIRYIVNTGCTCVCAALIVHLISLTHILFPYSGHLGYFRKSSFQFSQTVIAMRHLTTINCVAAAYYSVFVQRCMVIASVMTSSACTETWSCISVVTKPRHRTLSSAMWMQTESLHPVYPRTLPLLSFHLCFGLSNGLSTVVT